jgi:hypothetical protein
MRVLLAVLMMVAALVVSERAAEAPLVNVQDKCPEGYHWAQDVKGTWYCAQN